MNNHEASLEYLNKALVYAPGWALPYINLNIRYQKVKEFNKSLEAGFNAIRVDSGFVLGYQSLSGTYIQMKEYESARKYLFKSLDLDSLNQRTFDFIECHSCDALTLKALRHKGFFRMLRDLASLEC